MGVIRVYIKPFSGYEEQEIEYVNPPFPSEFKPTRKGIYADDWIDVSADIVDNQINNISLNLDYGDYDVGVFKFNEMDLVLNNKQNRYGNADAFGSIFKYKRTNSLVKITWDIQPFKAMCGAVPCGAVKIFESEIILFEGILNDETYLEDVDNTTSRFKLLGFESLYQKRVTYTTLAGPSTRIDLILKSNEDIRTGPLPILSDPTLDLLTYDTANFNPAYPPDFTVPYPDNDMWPAEGWLWAPNVFKDDYTDLSEALKANNSVLLIENRNYIVKDRTPNQVTPEYTFYGQGANGPENIISITEIKNGLNRSFNEWSFSYNASPIAKDEPLIQNFGRRPKILDFDMSGVAGTGVADYLAYMISQWADPKIELRLTTPMNISTVQLKILDRVNVDLPTVTYANDDTALYGIGEYGVDSYADEAFSFTVDASVNFKIMGIDYNISDQTITFLLREI